MRCSYLGFVLFICSSVVAADFSVSLNENSQFVLSGQMPDLLAIEFASPSGALIPSANDDAGAFQFLLANNPRYVTFGSLRPAVALDGELVLPVGMQSLSENDVLIRFGAMHDDGALEPMGSNPPTWSEPTFYEIVVDDIRLQRSAALDANQFTVTYYKSIEANHGGSDVIIGSSSEDTSYLTTTFHEGGTNITIAVDDSSVVASDSFAMHFADQGISTQVNPSEKGQDDFALDGISWVDVGSWEFAENFSYDGETAIFVFDGERAEIYSDGSSLLPNGWSATRYDHSIEFTVGDATIYAATPEPTSGLMLLAMSFVCLTFRELRCRSSDSV